MKFTQRFGALLVVAALTFSASSSKAALHQWTGGAGNDDWFNAANWDTNTVPGPGDNTDIGTSATVSIATVRINTGGAANPRNLTLGFSAGDSGTLIISNGSTLTTDTAGGTGNFIVGASGDGTFTMRDTTVTTVNNDMRVGDQATSTGSVDLHDSAQLGVFGNLVVGNFGAATVDLHDNSVIGFGPGLTYVPTNVTLGNNAGSVGTMTLHDSSVLNVDQDLTVGNAGTGTLNVNDTSSVGPTVLDAPVNTFIGRQAGGVGLVKVNGGTFNANASIFVGGNVAGPGGQGELRIVNGGTVNVGTGGAPGTLTVWGPGSGSRGELSVDSTYTINQEAGSTIDFKGGELNFLGDGVDFINDAVLTNVPGPDQNGMFANVGDDNTATISGLLSGNGQLVKNGTGTLILSNINNTYSGGTNINNGTLQVGAATPGVTLPGPYASVFGLGDVNLNNAATLQGTPGTATAYVINGNFNANGSAPDAATLVINLGGTPPETIGVSSDFIGVVGSANLTVGTGLFAHRLPGAFFADGDKIKFLETLGVAVNGTFFQQQGDLIPNDFGTLIQPFVSYDPGKEVDAVFGFAASFASVAKTPNQIATAEALDAAVAAGCIVNATNVLGNAPINTLRHAYDLIAPEELASMYEASFAQGMVQSLNLQHRMDDVRWGSTGFCADGFVVQDNHGYTKNDGKSVADKNPVEETPPPNYRWGSFITGTGELTKVGQEDDNAAGYQLNNASFTMGVDYRVTDHWAIGLSGGYTHTDGNLVDDGRLNTDGGRLGLYTTWYTGGFYVDASASGGWNQYDTRRTAYLGTEQGSTDGAEFDGMVAAGYDWKKGCWIFGPYADFEYSYVEFNSFTEGDTSLIPLHFPDQNQNAYRSNLGLRIAHEQVMKPGEGLTVVPEVRAAWRHDFGGTSYAIDSNFVGCDDTFTVHGPYIGTDSAVVDIGLTAYCTQQLSAYIFYQGQFGRDNYNNNAISGGLRFAF